jgi:hypothetical protein
MGQYERDRNYLDAERHFQVTGLMASAAVAPKLPKFTFSVDSEFRIVGNNPEMADLDNPRGDLIRERFFMVATDSEGRQYRYGNTDSPEAAEIVFQHFAPAVEAWPFFRCVYGSTAYQEDGCEVETLREEMETELGPEYYRHPHVQHYPMHVFLG